jgi:hypothetical protein
MKMATGKRAFAGKSQASVVAAILAFDPAAHFDGTAYVAASAGSRG